MSRARAKSVAFVNSTGDTESRTGKLPGTFRAFPRSEARQLRSETPKIWDENGRRTQRRSHPPSFARCPVRFRVRRDVTHHRTLSDEEFHEPQ
jgi:hypothetical protein